jgi:hypothetical protein
MLDAFPEWAKPMQSRTVEKVRKPETGEGAERLEVEAPDFSPGKQAGTRRALALGLTGHYCDGGAALEPSAAGLGAGLTAGFRFFFTAGSAGPSSTTAVFAGAGGGTAAAAAFTAACN